MQEALSYMQTSRPKLRLLPKGGKGNGHRDLFGHGQQLTAETVSSYVWQGSRSLWPGGRLAQNKISTGRYHPQFHCLTARCFVFDIMDSLC